MSRMCYLSTCFYGIVIEFHSFTMNLRAKGYKNLSSSYIWQRLISITPLQAAQKSSPDAEIYELHACLIQPAVSYIVSLIYHNWSEASFGIASPSARSDRRIARNNRGRQFTIFHPHLTSPI